MGNDALSGLDDLSALNNENELPHLSDAIFYDTDIAPYRYIQIYAGVGSGKNTFINRYVKQEFSTEQLLEHKAALNCIRFDDPIHHLDKINSLLKLIDIMEDDDDVQNVWHNREE